MTKITVTDTALKAGEPWAYAPVVVDLCDSNGDTVYPAYVTATGVLVETFTTVADADGLFTLVLDPTDAIAPTGCLYSVTIGDADAILIQGDQGDGTVRSLRTTTPTVLGNTATLSGLSDVDLTGRVDGSVIEWDTTTSKWIMGSGGGGGGVSSVSGTAPITSTGGATPAIGITAATASDAGSMSAADKSKLDGIEAGATADQSASEILAKVVTVDGTGSGLDADLLDGQHASAFDAAGAAATVAGNLTSHTSATGTSVHGLGGASVLNVGTTAGTVAAGDDSRLSDARTPSGSAGGDLSGTYPNPTIGTGKVTSTHILDGTITGTDISSSAAIALSQLASISTARILGRTTAGTGAIEELTQAGVFGFLGTGTPSSSTYLRGDGTWSTPSGGGGFDLAANMAFGG